VTGSVLQQRTVLESLAIRLAMAQVDFGIYLPVAYLSLVVVIRRARDATGSVLPKSYLTAFVFALVMCVVSMGSLAICWTATHELSYRKRPLIVTIR
jgi:hypothetical protein